MQYVNWCLAHWELVLLAAWAVLSLLNAVTEHADSAKGMRWFLLGALDVISGLQSRDATRGVLRGVQPKLPILQLSARRDGRALVKRIEAAQRGEG
jgi:hypothetical protein